MLCVRLAMDDAILSSTSLDGLRFDSIIELVVDFGSGAAGGADGGADGNTGAGAGAGDATIATSFS